MKRLTILGACIALALAISGCGQKEEGDTAATPTPATTGTPPAGDKPTDDKAAAKPDPSKPADDKGTAEKPTDDKAAAGK